LSIKLALKYAQLRDVESMRAVARAHQNRDLAAFEQTLRDYREELSSDPTIRSHLAALYDTLLEQNLLRIVEPYSVVEIEYVAGQVSQGRQDVEAKYAAPLPLAPALHETDLWYPAGQTLSDDFRQGLPWGIRSRTRVFTSIR
jgi:hypothetical protein